MRKEKKKQLRRQGEEQNIPNCWSMREQSANYCQNLEPAQLWTKQIHFWKSLVKKCWQKEANIIGTMISVILLEITKK